MSHDNITQNHLMKKEPLVVNVTAVGSPRERNVLCWGWFWLGAFFDNSGPIRGQGATLWFRNPLLCLHIITKAQSVKIVWLVANVTAVVSPDRAERAIWDVFGWALFLPIQAVLVVGEPLRDVGTLS